MLVIVLEPSGLPSSPVMHRVSWLSLCVDICGFVLHVSICTVAGAFPCRFPA
jgi:hypothetical protein